MVETKERQQLFIISYNVNSYQNRKNEVNKLLKLKPDILFLCETKLSKQFKQTLIKDNDGLYSDPDINDDYLSIFVSQDSKNGVGIFISKQLNLMNIITNIDTIEHSQGRLIQVSIQHKKQTISLLFLYVINAGRNLKTLQKRLKWDQQLYQYIQKQQDLICIMGDLNIIPSTYDIHDFKKHYNKSAGVTQQEIDNYYHLLNSLHYDDTIRYLHPQKRIYSYFSYFGNSKQNNKGWLLDRCQIKNSYLTNLIDSNIINLQKNGSDHLPIFVKFYI